MMAAGVFVLVNPQTKLEKLRFILEDSCAVALITEQGLESIYLEAISGAANLRRVIVDGVVSGKRDGQGPSVEELSHVLESTMPIDAPVRHIPTDLAALIYTSGSTGNPKGVMMSHESMVFAAGSVIEYLRLSPDDRILNLLPLAYSYGLYQLLMSVYLGATVLLEQSFTYPGQVIRDVKGQKITVFPAVPTVFTVLIGLHRRSPLELPSVQCVTNAAAALPASYNRELHEIFPNALIYRMYGLTECKRVCYLDPELVDKKPDSVGKAIPGTETLLLSESGEPVGPGEVGILHVRGPHIMRGYWNQPELTRAMLKDGPTPGEKMLCAQDWFTMDEDGDLYFRGRSDDIIKTGGEKVSPVEVENALYEIAGIREAAVIGVPDDLLGQAVKAIVVLEGGCSLGQTEILRFCASRLENLMVPKYVEFRTELPRTSSGKIRKASLRQ